MIHKLIVALEGLSCGHQTDFQVDLPQPLKPINQNKINRFRIF